MRFASPAATVATRAASLVFFEISWMLAIICSTETETLSTLRLICSDPDETMLACCDVSSALEIIWVETDESPRKRSPG